MPDVTFKMPAEIAQQMSDSVFDKLSQAVEEAVCEVLHLAGPQEVAVYEVVARRTHNAPRLLILCEPLKSVDRIAKEPLMRNRIAAALRRLANDDECAEFFGIVGKIKIKTDLTEGGVTEVNVARDLGGG